MRSSACLGELPVACDEAFDHRGDQKFGHGRILADPAIEHNPIFDQPAMEPRRDFDR